MHRYLAHSRYHSCSLPASLVSLILKITGKSRVFKITAIPVNIDRTRSNYFYIQFWLKPLSSIETDAAGTFINQ